MHQRHHNLTLHWTRRPSHFHRGLVLGLVLSLIAPAPLARAAASKSQLLQVGSFMGLAGAVWRLNKAMRAMADSPLEKWRRDEVNQAMAALPSAIQGLAGDFQSQKLGNSSLPVVFSMLGGFVDKNAADNYSKFLQNPSHSLIPKLGADFPAEAKVENENTKLFYESANREALAATKDFSATETKPVVQDGQQIINLANFRSGTRGLSQGQGASSGLFYDRDASVSGVSNEAKKAGSIGSRPSSVLQTKADIAQIESGISGLTILNGVNRKKAEELEQSEGEASAMFKSVGKDQAIEKAPAKRPRASKPVSFHGIPVLKLASLLIFGSDAHAQQTGQNGMQPEPGSKAAEILFGMAAIIGAIVPIFVASSQAESQQETAQTQANAQIQMTQMSAQTSKELANMSAATAREQAMITQDLAQKQIASKKENLQINLSALEQQRKEVRDAEREQLAIEKEFNEQRVALAQQQLNENIRVSQAALNAQLVQGGLATGLTTTAGDSNRLAVTSLTGTGSSVTSSAATTTANAAGDASSLGSSLGGTATPTGLVATPKPASLGLKSTPKSSSGTLVASALGTPIETMEAQAGVKTKKASASLATKKSSALGLVGSTKSGIVLGTARGTYAHGLAAVASGSFRNEKQVVDENPVLAESDLEKFRNEASAGADAGSSFSEWRSRRFQQAAQESSPLHRDGPTQVSGHRGL